MTLDRCATDNRGKAHGLMSLVTGWHGDMPIVPYYASSIAQAYFEAALAEVEGRHFLQALQVVPVLSSDSHHGLRGSVIMTSHFPVSRSRLCDVEILENSVLRVLGHFFHNSVSHIFPRVWGKTSEGFTAMALAATFKA